MDERRSVFLILVHFSGLSVIRSGCFGFLESFVCYVSCGIFIFLFREHIVLSCPRFSCILVFFFYLLAFMCLLMVEGCFFAKKQEF